MSTDNKFPTEIVDLPSKGLLYSEDSPLRSGTIEMKYMTAKEEDILTNQNYIQKGVVVDKLLQALIVDKTVDYKSILVADKNALLLAARILGYGSEYEFQYLGETFNIDLSTIDNKEIHPDIEASGKNEFNFTLPYSKDTVTFKLLTHGDELKVEAEVKGLQKINKESSPELSTRLKHTIVAIGGDSDVKTIREYIDTRFLARDSRALRKHLAKIQPDVNLKFYPENGPEEGVDVPIGINFLWPDADI